MSDARRKDKEEVELLEELEVIGDSPWYLTKLFILCMVPSILNGLNVTSYVYLTDVPGHWCSLPELDNTTWSLEQKLNLSSPKGSGQSSCEYYDLDYDSLSQLSYDEAFLAAHQNGTPSIIPCKSREYDRNVTSMVLDFDLVCERTVFKPTIQVAISVGKFLGAFLFGIVSDKYGRRVSFLCGSLLYMLSGPLIGAANSYSLVIVGRIGLGAAGSGIYHSAFVILSEIASKRRRASLGILYNMSYPIGQMVVPIVAYFIRDWRTLQYILSAPAVAILAFWWYLPESPMWLLSKNRKLEAGVYIRNEFRKLRASDTVKLKKAETESADEMVVSSPGKIVAAHAEQHPPQPPPPPSDWKKAYWEKITVSMEQLFQLVRYGELRWRLVIVFFTWCTCSFSYYGLALNVDNFETNRYVYGFITGLVEAPSYILPLPLLKWMGRRYTAISLFYIGGIALLLILVLPDAEGLNIPLLVVASIGRLCVSGVFAVCILQTTELFPTLLRNTAIGIGSTSSHIGSMSAPLFVDLVGPLGKSIPSTVFGLLTIASGTLTFLLPETKNKELPNTVQDIVNGPKESKVGLHQFCR